MHLLSESHNCKGDGGGGGVHLIARGVYKNKYITVTV